MQGKKRYQEKLFTSFQLSAHIPEDNFYRRLGDILDLSFLYEATKPLYGKTGNPGIDPVVFAKLCLVGYLENIASDRKLMDHCAMRMDILYFLGYDIDEPLPWHSTLSRTRQLYGEEVFEQLFTRIVTLCVDKGMVSGHTQVVDSAPVKANASMDSLELKVPQESLQAHLRKVRAFSAADREPYRKAAKDKSSPKQRKVQASQRELQEISTRNKKWAKEQTQRPGAKNKGAKYTSNKTHYSPTDPDARISVKPGKARKLNYTSQMAVDTARHVITHIQADFADKKDNQSLAQVVDRLQHRLSSAGLQWENLLADTGYSSGENYAMLEAKQLQAYIPPHGTYKGGPQGFIYHKEGDYWLCPNNKKATFRKVKHDKSRTPYGSGIIKKKQYLTRRSDCKGCPLKASCIGKAHEKRIDITFYKDEYERTIQRLKTPYGKRAKALRQSTVEPVFGVLTQFMAMQKVFTIGIKQANKQMLMAATAYNLKKYLKFKAKKVSVHAMKAAIPDAALDTVKKALYQCLKPLSSPFLPHQQNLWLKAASFNPA